MNWPDPDKPGHPLNPERDGAHWITDNVAFWEADTQRWLLMLTAKPVTAEWLASQPWAEYRWPCLTPAEVAAREQAARREGMEEAARIADAMQPSSASAVGEAHMRSFRNAIAYAIRAAAKESNNE